MQFVSLKSVICHMFAKAVNTEPLKGNKVFFLTPAGIVSGVPTELNAPDDLENVSAAVSKGILTQSIEFFEEELREKGEHRAPHDGYILLKNATIQPMDGSPSVNAGAFVLFQGSVIGVFCGNAEQAHPESDVPAIPR